MKKSIDEVKHEKNILYFLENYDCESYLDEVIFARFEKKLDGKRRKYYVDSNNKSYRYLEGCEIYNKIEEVKKKIEAYEEDWRNKWQNKGRLFCIGEE